MWRAALRATTRSVGDGGGQATVLSSLSRASLGWRASVRAVASPVAVCVGCRFASTVAAAATTDTPPSAPPASSSPSADLVELPPSPAVPLSPGSATWMASSSSLLGPAGRIMIYASEVSALVGLNTFKPLHEPFERVWARTDPSGYATALARAEALGSRKLLTRDQRAELILASEEGAQAKERLDQALASVRRLSLEELEVEKAALRGLASAVSGLGSEQVDQLADYLIGQVSKAYGVLNEARALAAFELVAGFTVRDNNTFFYGREIGEAIVDPKAVVMLSPAEADSIPDSTDSTAESVTLPSPPLLRRSFWIGGRVDGFSSVSGDLIELKNRTRKFLSPLPLYDRCQLECYLQVCEVEEGELVERLRKKVTPEEAAKEHAKLTGNALPSPRDDMGQSLCRPSRTQLEQEDTSFLQSTGSKYKPRTPASTPTITSEPIATLSPNSAASSVDFDTEEDTSFLTDTRPIGLSEGVEDDPSFLTSDGLAAAPEASRPSRPQLGIFATKTLSASQSVTHMLVRETVTTDGKLEAAMAESSSGNPNVEATAATAELMQSMLHAAEPEILELDTTPTADDAAAPASSSSLYIDAIKRTRVVRDPSLWSTTILPPLATFSHFLARFLVDAPRQLRYLQATDEEKLEMLGEIVPKTKYGYQKFDRAAWLKSKVQNEQKRRAQAADEAPATSLGGTSNAAASTHTPASASHPKRRHRTEHGRSPLGE